MKQLFTLLFIFWACSLFAQATFTTTGQSDGKWNNTASWQLLSGTDADGIPDADDHVQVAPGHTLIAEGSPQCQSLKIEDHGEFTELIVVSGSVLSVIDLFEIRSEQKTSEVNVDVQGDLSAGRTEVLSFGQDVSITLKVRKNASFMVASRPVTRVQELSSH